MFFKLFLILIDENDIDEIEDKIETWDNKILMQI